MGFKRKNQYTFVRTQNEALQSICFTHSTHGESFVKHYNITLDVEYPEVNNVLSQLNYNGNTSDGFGINIGYLYEEGYFKEYRIADNDNDRMVSSIIDSMVSDIRIYGLPYFEKYSTIESAIIGMETSKITCTALWPKYSLPVFYLTKGWNESALIYVKNMEEQIQKGYEKQIAECLELRKLHGNIKMALPNDYYYRDYQLFAKKVRVFIGRN
jgi:hypothetical protein